MSKLVFLLDPSVVYEGELIEVNPNILRVTFASKVPAKNVLTSGVSVINEHNGKVMASNEDFKTIYRTYKDNKVVELSNDGSVWVQPEQPEEPKKKITFIVEEGGKLEGKTLQEVYNFKELTIPAPVADENYKFVKWNPEVPTSGEVKDDKVFTAEFEYIPTEEELRENFESARNDKIILSKTLLSDYLERHPLVSNCHGGKEAAYTVTSEKQTLMANNYMTYTIAKQSGIENPALTWNAVGEECEVWTEEEYVTLVLQIAEYVKPLVALQQSYEVQINACKTEEELDAIAIVYDVYGASL